MRKCHRYEHVKVSGKMFWEKLSTFIVWLHCLRQLFISISPISFDCRNFEACVGWTNGRCNRSYTAIVSRTLGKQSKFTVYAQVQTVRGNGEWIWFWGNSLTIHLAQAHWSLTVIIFHLAKWLSTSIKQSHYSTICHSIDQVLSEWITSHRQQWKQ